MKKPRPGSQLLFFWFLILCNVANMPRYPLISIFVFRKLHFLYFAFAQKFNQHSTYPDLIVISHFTNIAPCWQSIVIIHFKFNFKTIAFHKEKDTPDAKV